VVLVEQVARQVILEIPDLQELKELLEVLDSQDSQEQVVLEEQAEQVVLLD
jgi:hypothetical protein